MPPLEFRAFDIEIGPGDGYTYPVAVLNSPAGEARLEIEWPFSPSELEDWLNDLNTARFADNGEGTEALTREFGGLLFDALIQGDIRSRYDVSRQMTRDENKGLRLKLRVNAPDLATLPWELLHDPRAGEFVALSRHTPIVRYLEVGQPARQLQVKPPLRILGMVASPQGVEPLDVEAERARIEEAVAPLVDDGQVELVWLDDPTWRGLQEAMQAGPWHVFHFIGHAEFDEGTGEGVIVVADDNGQAANLSAADLARLLVDQRTLRLVTLNACEGARGDEGSLFSSMAATLVERGLSAVLAMQYEISDEAAIEFSSSFYGALANGYPIDAATGEARKALSLAQSISLEWATPVLFMRAADGMLWAVTKKDASRTPMRLLAFALVVVAVVAVFILIRNQAKTNRILSAPTQTPTSTATATPTSTPTATPTPEPMGGLFNIAVARFGELDDKGSMQPSKDGARLSQWVFETLTDEFEVNRGIFGRDIKLKVLDESFNGEYIDAGTLIGVTDEDRKIGAEALAKQIRASMVIYGNLATPDAGDASNSDRQLQLEFYLSPLFGEEAQQVVGYHTLGDALPVSDSLEGFGSFETAGPLETRAQALAGLTIALIYDLLGDHEKALTTLLDLDNDLTDWDDDQGKELLYFLTGRQQLFLDQYDEAAESADSALTARPGYSRAHVLLGSVFARRAINEMMETQTPERENTSRALAEYEAAAISAENEGNDLVAQTARLALASAYVLEGQGASLAGEPEAAIAALDRGLAELDGVYSPMEESGQFRYLAQAHQNAGNAYFLKADVLGRAGDLAGRSENLQAARDAYDRCIAQGVRAPADKTLQEKVIDQLCQPMFDTTLDELRKMEATS